MGTFNRNFPNTWLIEKIAVIIYISHYVITYFTIYVYGCIYSCTYNSNENHYHSPCSYLTFFLDKLSKLQELLLDQQKTQLRFSSSNLGIALDSSLTWNLCTAQQRNQDLNLKDQCGFPVSCSMWYCCSVLQQWKNSHCPNCSNSCQEDIFVFRDMLCFSQCYTQLFQEKRYYSRLLHYLDGVQNCIIISRQKKSNPIRSYSRRLNISTGLKSRQWADAWNKSGQVRLAS